MALIGLSYSQDQFPEFPIYPDFLFIPETEETAAYTYQAEALALFARMEVQPDETRKQLIDGLITNLKTAGLWSGFDAFWGFAAHDQQAAPLNWIKDDHNCTEVNSPAFEVDRGYTGNGTTSYLNSDFKPTDGINYTQNNCAIFIYLRTNQVGASVIDFGSNDGTNGQVAIWPNVASTARGYINSALDLTTYVIASAVGLTSVSRNSDTNVEHYKNGIKTLTDTRDSAARNSADIFILAFNGNGTPSSFSTKQVCFAAVGRYLTENEQATLFSLVEAYLDAIGAGVME